MNKIIKDALLLTLITIVAGGLLGLVYEITKAPIEKVSYQAQQDAYKAVFDGADSFEEMEVDSAALSTVAETYPDDSIDGVVAAKDASGSTLGYVLTITSHAGYGGDITFSIGVTNEGVLNGYSITDISETAGLGMKAKEAKFQDQFKDISFDSGDEFLEVDKVDSGAKHKIDAISGATITSKAMTYGTDAGLLYFRTALEGGGADE